MSMRGRRTATQGDDVHARRLGNLAAKTHAWLVNACTMTHVALFHSLIGTSLLTAAIF